MSRKRSTWVSKDIVPIFLAPLGTFLFFAYHYFAFGSFLLFFKVEKVWGRAFHFNPDHFHAFTAAATANLALDAFFVAVIIALIVLIAKRLRLSYAVYMGLTVAVALSTGTLMSIGRYILVLFPIYVFAASIKNAYIKQAWIFASILLLAFNITLFVHFHWAG